MRWFALGFAVADICYDLCDKLSLVLVKTNGAWGSVCPHAALFFVFAVHL